MKRIFPIIIITLLVVGFLICSAYALCPHTEYIIRYNNTRTCGYNCGFLGLRKQNVWDETIIYTCADGGTERVTNYDVHNGTCCY